MEQKFGAPFEVIPFTRILTNRALQLVDGRQGVAQFLVQFAGEPICVGVLAVRHQAPHMLARAGEVSCALQGFGKVEFIRKVIRTDTIRSLQRWDGIVIFPSFQIELTQSVVRFKLPGSLRERGFERFLPLPAL